MTNCTVAHGREPGKGWGSTHPFMMLKTASLTVYNQFDLFLYDGVLAGEPYALALSHFPLFNSFSNLISFFSQRFLRFPLFFSFFFFYFFVLFIYADLGAGEFDRGHWSTGGYEVSPARSLPPYDAFTYFRDFSWYFSTKRFSVLLT